MWLRSTDTPACGEHNRAALVAQWTRHHPST
jgi:hypothetical protein